MAGLIKELSDLLDKLDDLYFETEDKAEKKKLGIYIDELSKRLGKAISVQFDENETIYQNATTQLKEAEKAINKLKKGLENITNFFKLLTDITLQLDTLLFKPLK